VATAEEAASICNKQKKKKNILPFSVSARRFGFGPSPFPARLVIVVRGSSRALGGGSLAFQRTPGSGSSNTAQSKNRRLKCNVALASVLFCFF